MPNFFITLSCAEYFWPDVLCLLNERLKIAGHTNAVSTNFIMHYFFNLLKTDILPNLMDQGKMTHDSKKSCSTAG
jgi:hypothetical protein